MPRVVDISPRILPRAVNRPGLAEGIGSGLELLAADRKEKQALELRTQERQEDRDAVIAEIEARGQVGQELAVTRGGIEGEHIIERGVITGGEIVSRGEQQRETDQFGFDLAAPQLAQENIFAGQELGLAGEAQRLREDALEAQTAADAANEAGRNERARLQRLAGVDEFPLRGLAATMIQGGNLSTAQDAITVARGRAPGGTVRSPTDLPKDAVEQFEVRPGGFIQTVEEARELDSMSPEEHVQIGLALLASPQEFKEYLEALNPELAAQVKQMVEAEARRLDNPQGRR